MGGPGCVIRNESIEFQCLCNKQLLLTPYLNKSTALHKSCFNWLFCWQSADSSSECHRCQRLFLNRCSSQFGEEKKKTKGCICNEVPNWNSIIHTLSLAQLSVLTSSTADMVYNASHPGPPLPRLCELNSLFVARYYICWTMLIIIQLSSNYPHSEDHFASRLETVLPFFACRSRVHTSHVENVSWRF